MNKEEILDKAEKLVYEVIEEDNLYNWDNLSPHEIATMIRKLLNRIDELENHIYYKNCVACGKEFKAKRKDAKYCVYCSRSMANRVYYLGLTEEQKQKRREQAKICMRKIRTERGKKMNKEEKEAIKYLDMMENKINFDLLGYIYGNETIDTILNLIQKQEKIIENYEEMIINHKKQLKQSGIYGYDYDLKIIEKEVEKDVED